MGNEYKFKRNISKGSKFNQIYIPLEVSRDFEVGDLVEVRLIAKNDRLHFSKNLDELNGFKKKFIKDVFSFLKNTRGIEQVFIFGSFLTSSDWNDIDILVVGNANGDKLSEKLKDNFGFKFHLIVVNRIKLDHLIRICPLTRSMLYYSVSDKEIKIDGVKIIDNNHIKYLLMIAEDILEVDVGGNVFYDVLRRLVSIEMFLKSKEVDPLEIRESIKKLLGKDKLDYLKNEGIVEGALLGEVREFIKAKLIEIEELLNGKKG